MAATSMSARWVKAARSAVFEWHIVTVAEAFSSSMAHGFADDVAAAEHDGVFAGYVDPTAAQHLHDAGGGTRLQAGLPALQTADVHGMEAVDILIGSDGFEEPFGVDVGRQRKLNEDAVDLVAGVQVSDHGQQLFGGNALGRGEHFGVDSELAAGLYLAAHVDFTGGDGADEDDRKPRPYACIGECAHGDGDLGFDLRCDGDSVEDYGRMHGSMLSRYPGRRNRGIT